MLADYESEPRIFQATKLCYSSAYKDELCFASAEEKHDSKPVMTMYQNRPFVL